MQRLRAVLEFLRQRHAVAACHRSLSAAGIVGADLETRRIDEQSSGYSLPLATTPFSVMRSTPLPAVSICQRVTLAGWNVSRY